MFQALKNMGIILEEAGSSYDKGKKAMVVLSICVALSKKR